MIAQVYCTPALRDRNAWSTSEEREESEAGIDVEKWMLNVTTHWTGLEEDRKKERAFKQVAFRAAPEAVAPSAALALVALCTFFWILMA